MIHRGLACLLLAGTAWAQTPSTAPAAPPPQAANAPTAAAPASTVPPDAPVITIDGLCNNPPADKTAATDCKTVVTRAEFEKLLEAVAPTLAAPARRQLATRYATGLVMAHDAHEMGLDQGPKYDELLKLARIQVLSQALGQALQEKAGQISDKDIEDYYKTNDAAYQEADLQRIFIPKAKQLPPPQVKLSDALMQKRQKDAEEAMRLEANALHARAVKGESFATLQAEAFTFAGLKAKPPSTSMGVVRRASLPPTQAEVFDLKSGEISAVIVDATGFFIFKVGAKDTVAMDKVKEEIHNTLRGQRMQESMQAVQQAFTPKLDDAYFGPPAAPAPRAMPPMPGMPPGANKPMPPPHAKPDSDGPK